MHGDARRPRTLARLKGDAVNDPMLLDIAAMADIISPWTVGRYSDRGGRQVCGEQFENPTWPVPRTRH